jgi:hypothetical protein
MRSPRNALLVFAYVLLLIASVPAFAKFETLSWGLVPLWLVLVGHTLNLMRFATPKQEDARRFEVAALTVWATYFMIAIMWPLHMHWFDALLVLSLFLDRSSPIGLAMFSSYYVFSLAFYMSTYDPLQVSSRAIMAGTLVQDIFTLQAGGAVLGVGIA